MLIPNEEIKPTIQKTRSNAVIVDWIVEHKKIYNVGPITTQMTIAITVRQYKTGCLALKASS